MEIRMSTLILCTLVIPLSLLAYMPCSQSPAPNLPRTDSRYVFDTCVVRNSSSQCVDRCAPEHALRTVRLTFNAQSESRFNSRTPAGVITAPGKSCALSMRMHYSLLRTAKKVVCAPRVSPINPMFCACPRDTACYATRA